MSMVGGPDGHELVVAEDGRIPSEQITRLGMRPGMRLRVVAEQPPDAEGSIGGQLVTWPDLTWEDFERASQLAQADLNWS